MRSFHPKFFLFAITAFIFTACEKEKNVTPLNIEGKWMVDSSTSKVQFQGEEVDNSTEDLSNTGIYFDFAANGTYTTNAILGLGNINKGDGSIYSNEYAIVDGKVALTFDEADLKIPITLSFQPQISGDRMTIKLTRNQLVNDIADMSGKISGIAQGILEVLVSTIVDFEYTLELVKA